MFSRADGFRIMGGTFNVNTHQPTTAHNQPNPYPPAVCASEIIARLESIERRITDFGRQVQVQVQAQEALEVDHADHCPFIPQNDVQYPFQKTAIDPGALYDMASREYLCQGDESSTSSTSSSIVRDKFERDKRLTLEPGLTLGYATSNPARPNCSFKQSPYKIDPIDNWNEPTIGSTIKRRCSDGSVAKRQRKRLDSFEAMQPQADFPSPEFGLSRPPRSLETWTQSDRSLRPYGRRPTNHRRRAIRKAFSPEEQIIDNKDSDTFSVGAPASKSIRRHSFPFVEQRCRGHCRSSC